MKSRNKFSLIHLLVGITLIFSFSACEKSEKIQESSDYKLSFDIKGFNQTDEIKEFVASSRGVSKTKKATTSEVLKETKKFDFNGLEAEAEIYELASPYTPDAKVESAKTDLKAASGKVLSASTSPLDPLTKYRVLVYESNGTYMGAIDGTQGTLASSLAVSFGKTYHWYAYSFGDANPLPAITNTGDPSINAIPSLGLLYASGTVSPTILGDNKVEVVFERRMSWIQLIIDARGTFAPIIPDGTKITTSNLTSSTFKIKSNTYVNPQSAVGTLEGSGDLTQLDYTTTKDSVYVGNFYLSDDGRNAPFQINIESVQLLLDYQLNVSVGNAKRTFNHVPYNFAFTPEPGKRYSVRIRLIESGVNIGGTLWARGNLHYTWGDNGFRFRHSGKYPYASKIYPWKYIADPLNSWYFNYVNGMFIDSDNYSDFRHRPVEFWNFYTKVPYAGTQTYDIIKIYNDPANTTGVFEPFQGKGYYYENISGFGPEYYSSIPSGDPCALVFPAGKWRLPTKKEAQTLINNLQSNTNKTVITDYTNKVYTGVFPYGAGTPDVYGSVIEFPFNGSITDAAGWSSGGWGPGYPSDFYGDNGDPRFQYERTNSYYWYIFDPYNPQNSNDKSAYMMYWTSDAGSTNAGSYPYAWAFVMKILDGQFVTPVSGAYPNLIGGYPESDPGGPATPQIREAYQGDGLNVRCVRM